MSVEQNVQWLNCICLAQNEILKKILKNSSNYCTICESIIFFLIF